MHQRELKASSRHWFLSSLVGALAASSACIVVKRNLTDPSTATVMPPRSSDCAGDPLPACPVGWTGPSCDIQCDAKSCDYRLYCHDDGRMHGLSTFGARLFRTETTWTATQVKTALKNFIVANPSRAGCTAGLRHEHISLEPMRRSIDNAGRLRIARYHQHYRGLPIFGPDRIFTVIMTPSGAISLKGSIIDKRSKFAHFDHPASSAKARASILAYAAAQTGIPEGQLQSSLPTLVAVPRARSIAWVADVTHGLAVVATVLVAADPNAEKLPLLLLDTDTRAGLTDEVPIQVLAEDHSSDVIIPPIETLMYDALYNGGDLVGSTFDRQVRLATERVVAYDVSRSLSFSGYTLIPPYGVSGGVFDSPDPSIPFEVQQAYQKVSSYYAWISPFMTGHWDSILGDTSPTEPSEFAPRILLWVHPTWDGLDRTETNVVKASEQSIALLPEEYEQPLGGSALYREDCDPEAETCYAKVEDLAYIHFTSTGSLTADTTAHEFGHVIDLFTGLKFADSGLGCSGEGCSPSCEEDSPEESYALVETIGQLSSVWLLTHVYGRPSTDCNALMTVSVKDNDAPHNQFCRPNGEPYSVFIRSDDPDCPSDSLCDKPSEPNFDPVNGLCSDDDGYRVISWHQAFWEIGHGQVCSSEPPYTCQPLDIPGGMSTAEALTPALLYPLRVDARTYSQFAEDFMTYIACNYDPEVYQLYSQIQDVFCHHRLLDCTQGLPTTPASCAICGNSTVEQGEECDGVNLDEQTCASQGFSGGNLSCTPDCQFDDALCEEDVASTGEAISESTGSESGEGSGMSGDQACNCRSGQVVSWKDLWMMMVLCFLRRRRQRIGSVMVMGSIIGCNPSGMNEDQSGDMGGSESAEWLIGDFSTLGDKVGSPIDPVLSVWQEVTFSPDGRGVERLYACTEIVEERDFTWSVREDGSVVDITPADGMLADFKWGVDLVDAVEIYRRETCEDLTVRQILRGGGSEVDSLIYRGHVCLSGGSTSKGCVAEVNWCDDEPPQPCE